MHYCPFLQFFKADHLQVVNLQSFFFFTSFIIQYTVILNRLYQPSLALVMQVVFILCCPPEMTEIVDIMKIYCNRFFFLLQRVSLLF